MENIKTTVGEVEEILYDRQDEINEEIQIYQIPVDGDETAQIETDGVRICIPELNVCARFGEYLRYDEDEEGDQKVHPAPVSSRSYKKFRLKRKNRESKAALAEPYPRLRWRGRSYRISCISCKP